MPAFPARPSSRDRFPTDAPRLPRTGRGGGGARPEARPRRVDPRLRPAPAQPEEIGGAGLRSYARLAPTTPRVRASGGARFEALREARAETVAAHEAALAEARAAWAAETADRLATLLAEGVGAIEERLSEATARALAPLLRSAARDRALEGLAEAVATLLRAEPALTLTMRGPADLGEALLARLGDVGAAIRFTPADTPDLHVEGADTCIETRLADWARRIDADAA